MSEKMREEFQVWFDANHKTENHSFNFAMSSAMFDAWQASRAALVVELPELESFNASDEPDFAYEVAIDDIKCALDDAGVGYK